MTASWILIALLGVLAGTTTTIAGMGGGLILLLSLAALTDPLTALVVTAPALLLGNAHRLWLYRSRVHRPTALRLALGAIPGALLGGAVATGLPSWVLSTAMLTMALLALARGLGRGLPVPTGATVPVGLLGGFVVATSGGAGVLVGPYLLGLGLKAEAYVATAAAGAVAMHLGRLLAYGAHGAADADAIAQGVLLALAIALGNLLGDRLQRPMAAHTRGLIQQGVMLACVGLAVTGLL